MKTFLLKSTLNFLSLFLFIFSFSLCAQKKPIWISLSHDNDILAVNERTDRYYSFGSNAEFAILYKKLDSSNLQSSKWNKIISISGGFNSFTPEHELENPKLEEQRPFLNHNYLTISHIKSNNQWYFAAAVQLGLTGDFIDAGKLQNWIHSNISGDPHVDGWDSQISERATLHFIFEWNKRIPISSKKFELYYGSNQSIGNLFTFIEPKLYFRKNISEIIGYLPFQYNIHSHKKLNLEVDIGFRHEFFNAALEGEYFHQVNQPIEKYVEKFLLTASAKLRYEWENFSFFYANFFNTKRLENDEHHAYGSLGVTFLIH